MSRFWESQIIILLKYIIGSWSSFFNFCCIKIRSYMSQADFKIIMKPKMSLSSWFSCFFLLGTRITGVYNNVQLFNFVFLSFTEYHYIFQEGLTHKQDDYSSLTHNQLQLILLNKTNLLVSTIRILHQWGKQTRYLYGVIRTLWDGQMKQAACTIDNSDWSDWKVLEQPGNKKRLWWKRSSKCWNPKIMKFLIHLLLLFLNLLRHSFLWFWLEQTLQWDLEWIWWNSWALEKYTLGTLMTFSIWRTLDVLGDICAPYMKISIHDYLCLSLSFF